MKSNNIIKKFMIILSVLIISTWSNWTLTLEATEIESREVNKQYSLGSGNKPFQIFPDMDYPSDIVFGFIKGCQEGFARIGAFSNKLWPEQLYILCGCMMDYTRKEIPYDVFLNRFRTPKLMTERDRKWIGEKLNICVTSITRSWAQNERQQGNEN